MTIKEFVECIDSKKKGIAWVNMYEDNILQCKFNSASSFIEPLYNKKIRIIEASGTNCFTIFIEKETEND